jgi:hypothetical protein
MAPTDWIVLDVLYVAPIAINDEPPPIPVLQEESRIGLHVILNTKLHESSGNIRQTLYQPLQNAVFPALGIHPEFCIAD